MEKKPDFLYRDEGSIILLLPQSETARSWAGENLQTEPWQDKRAIAIEPRYFTDILEGIHTEGMIIERLGYLTPGSLTSQTI